MDQQKVLVEERSYLANNEPTFYQDGPDGNTFVGKVGRLSTGEDIRIQIQFPDFYPVTKPSVKVLTAVDHPNVDKSTDELDLEILAYWEPDYRVKDILSATRRLFVKSKVTPRRQVQVARATQPVASAATGQITVLQEEISRLQAESNALDQEMQEARQKKLSKRGIDINSHVKITPKLDAQAELQAVDDLLELLEIKFEEAEINTVEFARLYRRYSATRFKLAHELEQVGGSVHELQNKKKTKEQVRL